MKMRSSVPIKTRSSSRSVDRKSRLKKIKARSPSPSPSRSELFRRGNLSSERVFSTLSNVISSSRVPTSDDKNSLMYNLLVDKVQERLLPASLSEKEAEAAVEFSKKLAKFVEGVMQETYSRLNDKRSKSKLCGSRMSLRDKFESSRAKDKVPDEREILSRSPSRVESRRIVDEVRGRPMSRDRVRSKDRSSRNPTPHVEPKKSAKEFMTRAAEIHHQNDKINEPSTSNKTVVPNIDPDELTDFVNEVAERTQSYKTWMGDTLEEASKLNELKHTSGLTKEEWKKFLRSKREENTRWRRSNSELKQYMAERMKKSEENLRPVVPRRSRSSSGPLEPAEDDGASTSSIWSKREGLWAVSPNSSRHGLPPLKPGALVLNN